SRAVTTGAGARGGQALLWDVESGREQASIESKAPDLRAAALSHDGKGFYLGDDSGNLSLHDLATGELRRQWDSLGTPIHALLALADGRLVVGAKNRLVVLDLATGQPTDELVGFSLTTYLASGGEGERFRLVAAGETSDSK